MVQHIAYLDCRAGVSGHTLLGALLDAGFALDDLRRALASVPVQGYQLKLNAYQEQDVRGSLFDVMLTTADQPVRHLSDVAAVLQASRLSARVQATSLAIFRRIAEAEAVVHRTSVDAVRFPKIGVLDMLISIVGVVSAVEALEITQLYASELPLTTGHISTAQGLVPVPTPATLELLRHTVASWKPTSVEGELVTPTGAAILAELARFESPAIAIERVGYGFGRKKLPWPDCVRLYLGHPHVAVVDETPATVEADTDRVAVIESHIDNMSGELLGALMEHLLSAGALDVSYTPLQMKKNRPATLLTVICMPEDGERLALVVLRESSTLGVRIQHVQRLKAWRSQELIETPLGALLVKIKRLGSRIVSASPEYEDCQRLARERDLPLAEVYEVAQRTIQATILDTQ
ncbi:MAG TPA: nickel pincer cofactor biosynthesis protein LarC [Ktedonobacteraceae bacterium]|nr:nickel pincer cofactor biosynthesis protein LarC [Ktedonobacteraceae bacterium]